MGNLKWSGKQIQSVGARMLKDVSVAVFLLSDGTFF